LGYAIQRGFTRLYDAVYLVHYVFCFGQIEAEGMAIGRHQTIDRLRDGIDSGCSTGNRRVQQVDGALWRID
jgi:hypothetical protein